MHCLFVHVGAHVCVWGAYVCVGGCVPVHVCGCGCTCVSGVHVCAGGAHVFVDAHMCMWKSESTLDVVPWVLFTFSAPSPTLFAPRRE